MKNKALFLAINISIILLSILTAFRVLPGPDLAGIILSFFSLFVIPGIYICLILSGNVSISAEGVSRIFFNGLIYVTFLSCLGFIPGWDYPLITIAGGVILSGMVVFYHLRPGNTARAGQENLVGSYKREEEYSSREKNTMFLILIIMVALCFVFFYKSGELGISTDAPDHVSFLRRSLETGSILPPDSFFREGDGTAFDPRKGLWHPVISIWAFQADAPPEYTWSFIPSFFAFFALVVFWFFTKELLGTIRLTLLASVLFLIFFRGNGITWLTKICYSKNISQVVLWGASGYIIRYLKQEKIRDIVMASLLLVTATAFHLVSSMVAISIITGIFIYTAIPGLGGRWQRRFVRVIPFLFVATAIPLVIRISGNAAGFNLIHTHRQGLLMLGETLAVVDPIEMMSYSGLVIFFAIIMSPFVFILARERKEAGLVGILFILPIFLVFNPFTATIMESRIGYLHYRLIDAAPVMGLLALVLTGLLRLIVTGRLSKDKIPGLTADIAWRTVSVVILGVFMLIPFRFALSGMLSAAGEIINGERDSSLQTGQTLSLLTDNIPANAVVLSDPVTSYLLSAYTDLFVVVISGQHGSPSDSLGVERNRNVRDFFNATVPISESRDWINETGIEYVIVNSNGSGKVDFFNTLPDEDIPLTLRRIEMLDTLFHKLRQEDGYVLFEIDRNHFENFAEQDYMIKSKASFSCAPELEVGERSRNARWGRVSLNRIHFDDDLLMPGDTVSGWFCWNISENVEFGFPLEWTMRLDTKFPEGNFYRPWYDKQYRRIIERKKGIFYRYTATGRLKSGLTFPDQWKAGDTVRQLFSFRLPDNMAYGKYKIRLIVRRASCLQNRRVSDYLRNRDSLYGALVGTVTIGKERVNPGTGSGADDRRRSDRNAG